MKKSLKYDEDSIQTFGVMEGIRNKSGMYIGATDNHGIFTIVREALDNCVDEFHAKRNKLVHIAIEDKVIYVLDEGNGIPVGKHKKEKKSTLTVILTQLHAGGKFNDKTYAYSGGTHGLGITITNAMSAYFKVWTKPKGKKDWYSTEFSKGKEISPVLKTKLTKKDLPNGMKIPKHGTIIAFTPDKTVFDKKAKLEIKHIVEWADLTAYINGGLRVKLTDKGKTTDFYHKGGISDYVDERVKLLKATPLGSSLIIKSGTVDLALKFTDYDGEKIEAYTNSIRNIDGGTHLTAFYMSLAKTLKPYALKAHNFIASDLREGIVGLINYKISSPKFNSQTKEKLVDDRVKEPATKTFDKELSTFFNKNKSLAKQLCCRAHELRNARQEFTMSKKAALKLKPKKGQKSLLPGKFQECRSCSPEDRVLFLVEGDSAAGPAKLARNLKYQEVLPLKGKILNVLKVKQEQKVWDNEEVMNILIAIGYRPNTKRPLDNLRVGKIVLLSDGDPDGPVAARTRILTLDGKNPTIKQLADKWEKNPEPFWVYSRDKKDNLVPALAQMPMEVVRVKQAYRIHFDNGTSVDCTKTHKWGLNVNGSIEYMRANKLKVGDSVNSVYLEERDAGGGAVVTGLTYKCIMNDNTKYCDRHIMPVHQWSKNCDDSKKFKDYREINKGVVGGALHIHHTDGNSLNNVPTNLEFIDRIEHFTIHGREMVAEYNGSDKHIVDLENFYSSEKGIAFKEIAGKRIAKFNKTTKNRESTAALNKRPDVIRLQMLGKVAKLYLGLKLAGLSVSSHNWNINASCRGIPLFKKMKGLFSTKDVKAHIKKHDVKEGYKVTNKKVNRKYPSQLLSKFIAVCSVVKDDGLKVTEETYNAARIERSVRGDPKWETGINSFKEVESISLNKYMSKISSKQANHSIIKIEKISHKDPEPYYCMNVPSTGNFMIDDGKGNGILSSNCHINLLELTLLAKYLPGLFDRKMVYIVEAPEFVWYGKDKTYYGDTLNDLRNAVPKGADMSKVFHIKGWGEVEPEVLRELAMDESTARLTLVLPPSRKEMKAFKDLMGTSIETRKKLLGI